MNRWVAFVAAGCAMATGLLWPREAFPHNPITTTVLFNREVVKIFQQKCVQCHAAGSLAMPLTTYEEARPWAVAIKEEMLEQRMPPWPAERGYGEFANDLGLTIRERDFLISWIDGGVPAGDGDPLPYLDHSAHWMLGTPDLLLTADRGVKIDPGRPLGFSRIVVNTALTQEKWLRALDYKPADKRVVRAAILSIAETGQYLGTWTPWRETVETPAGAAIRVPARARIAIDVFYQSASVPVVDTPKLGLYFAARRPAHEVATTVLTPPAAPVAGASAPRVKASMLLSKDISILEMRPDLGSLGRSVEVKAIRPDGSSQVLLWIRTFRPEWPTSYVLKKPVTLPKGSTLQAIAYFNSAPGQKPSPFSMTFTSYDAP